MIQNLSRTKLCAGTS